MLKHLKIKTKILCAFFLLGLISLAGLTYVVTQFSSTVASYSRFIAHESKGGFFSARASGAAWTSITWGLRLVTLQPGTSAYENAEKTYNSSYEAARKRLQEVMTIVPERAKAISEIIETMDRVKLVQDDLVKAAKANDTQAVPALFEKLDAVLGQLSPRFAANANIMTDNIDIGDQALSNAAAKAIYFSTVLIVAGVMIALGVAIYMAHAGITAPMTRLRARMETLAAGDVAQEIDGLDRRDEIGRMAATVAVFRDNSLERLRLAAKAEEDRNITEIERDERERQKAIEADSLQHAVEVLGDGLGKLAAGDLALQIDVPFVAHLDALRRDFNHSVSKLNEAMQAVGANSRAISNGANEIRQSADNLSQRTEQQAASVEETAAALEEITATVKDAAKRAEEASRLVAQTRAGAEASGQIVRNAVNAMQQIEKSSKEIGSIIGVIDDIAFQTNLLALNAGVEAARAGDAGKGFAVVAQEVRELAQRSANAAKEIKLLITASGAHVETGVSLVGDTGRALDSIVSEVQEINRHVHALAEASREQSVGLQEINVAINTMDQSTQQNAAMVEETTAASHGLASEAIQLNELLSQFRLAGGGEFRATAEAYTRHPAASTARPVMKAPRPAIRPADAMARPAASPARSLGQKLANAFGAGAPATSREADWTEF